MTIIIEPAPQAPFKRSTQLSQRRQSFFYPDSSTLFKPIDNVGEKSPLNPNAQSVYRSSFSPCKEANRT